MELISWLSSQQAWGKLMYMLVVLAIKEDPTLCPNMNIPDNPCTMVICPTKYLEHQMVSNGLVINGDTIHEAQV